MKKIDWVRKLTSRKFWLAIIGFVSALLIALNVKDITIEQVTAIISAFGVLVAYILGESYADGKHSGDDAGESEEGSATDAIGFDVDGGGE